MSISIKYYMPNCVKLAAHPQRGEPDEVSVFDYIYGVLHCPAYRETYAEFLINRLPENPLSGQS